MIQFQNPFAKTLFFFSLAEFSIGLGMLLLPELHAQLLGLSSDAINELRVIGILAIAFSYYYLRFALLENRDFAHFSIQVRLGLTIAWVVLMANGNLPLTFILLALYDLLSAGWTAKALWNSRKTATA